MTRAKAPSAMRAVLADGLFAGGDAGAVDQPAQCAELPAAATTALPSASMVTSHSTKRALAPSSRASAAPLSACTSAITTLPPLATIMREVAPPRPDAPPVTMNVLLIDLHESSPRSGGF